MRGCRIVLSPVDPCPRLSCCVRQIGSAPVTSAVLGIDCGMPAWLLLRRQFVIDCSKCLSSWAVLAVWCGDVRCVPGQLGLLLPSRYDDPLLCAARNDWGVDGFMTLLCLCDSLPECDWHRVPTRTVWTRRHIAVQ